jgi:exopolyphosphatase / guanosine-5'-triphosphate,3'-diphosphate pyrophosphatase
VANVARYHRGSPPKKKHENFQGLSTSDRLRVRQMAAVLRLAGGLDRSHNQLVKSAAVTGTPERVELLVAADELPEVDLWAVRRRAELFEEVFDAKLNIEWATSATAPHETNGEPTDQAAAQEPVAVQEPIATNADGK